MGSHTQTLQSGKRDPKKNYAVGLGKGTTVLDKMDIRWDKKKSYRLFGLIV